jgi:DNA-binding response OmpR family regulator
LYDGILLVNLFCRHPGGTFLRWEKVGVTLRNQKKLAHEPGMQALRGVPLVTGRVEKRSKLTKALQEKPEGAKDRILVVDDDRQSSALFVNAFKEAGFDAEAVTSISQARVLLMTGSYLALVFCLNLPSRQHPPMIIQGMARNPSSLLPPLGVRRTRRERMAINALGACLKRLRLHAPFPTESAFRLGNLELVLDHHGSHILVEGVPHNLSPTELAILEALLRREGRVISKDSIADYLNKGKAGVSHDAIHVYIHRLRKLLEHVEATVVIKTVKGVGYMIEETR